MLYSNESCLAEIIYCHMQWSIGLGIGSATGRSAVRIHAPTLNFFFLSFSLLVLNNRGPITEVNGKHHFPNRIRKVTWMSLSIKKGKESGQSRDMLATVLYSRFKDRSEQ